MALFLQKGLYLQPRHGLIGLITCRHKSHGNLRTKRLQNPFVQRNTDFIKLLSIALIKYERIQTTLERARKLEKYGNLLTELTKRKQPPPDITIVLQDGFLLRPDEIDAKFIQKKMINRRWKKRTVYPEPLSESEYVARCREGAINKLYGELAERYEGKYGGFVKVTRIPNKPRKHFPWLAYVEYHDNGLPPLPVMPVCKNGELYGRPREFMEHEIQKLQLMQINSNQEPGLIK